MDKIKKYDQVLKKVLGAYSEDRGAIELSPNAVKTHLLVDDENHHYQVLRMGWQNGKQVFSVIFHFDIINGKIWAQRNMSDYDIIGDIEAEDVPKSDIVLAFHTPEMRKFTEYADA